MSYIKVVVGTVQSVFIVEDDDNIRGMVIYALASVGFKTEGFAEGGEFFTALRESIPSLILLDIMLPGEDGISILKKLRQSEQSRHIPVIMLTAKGTEFDRVSGFDLGADDYVTKPFSVLEVISRVRAVLRRCRNNSGETDEIKIGGVTLYNSRRAVLVNDREITLTYKEFELLNYMMVNEGIVLNRDRLLNHVWGFDYSGESRTVDMHIKSLRQKLGVSGDMIKTVRNVGYKIMADKESI